MNTQNKNLRSLRFASLVVVINSTVFCDVHRVVGLKGTDVFEESTAAYSCSEKVPSERWYLCTELCQVHEYQTVQRHVRYRPMCTEVCRVTSGICVRK
jgi:hypothetical protein